MKQLLLSVIALVLTIAATGQTLKITTSSGTKEYQASQVTESSPATFTGGTTLTVGNDMFTISDITSVKVVRSQESGVEANTVNIVYNGSTATVTKADNISNYVTAEVSGAHVTITQTNTEAIDNDEITYVLSGLTTDGSLTLDGSYKCTISLAGLTMTNPNGAAIDITNKKRIQLSAMNGTENTLTDGSNGSQKACIYSKGQLQLQGKGTLNVAGNTKHAIKSGDYIEVKNLTLNITSAVADGISCEEYFQMKSGTVTISGVGDDGIQCDLGGDTSTGETTDHDDEDSGNVYLEGGTLNITVTAAAAKGIKADGDMKISDGDITVKTTGGGAWDSDDNKTKASSCLSADGNMTISGGTLNLTSTGAGGKGINGDGTFTATGGTTTIKTSGNAVISVTTTGAGGEGIESKTNINITGGQVTVNASDDAINSSYNDTKSLSTAGDLTISGGYVYARSTGNDGIDANGNCYIKGGLVYAIGTTSPEVAIDANSEERKQLYVTGGTIVAIGGLESGASLTQSCYSTNSWNKNTWYAMTVGSETFAFQTPSSGGSTMVVSGASQPTLKSSVTVSSGTEIFDGAGYTDATVTGGSSVNISAYTGGNQGGGFGPGGGGFGPGGGGWPDGH